jgi:hypothetical protein
VWGRLRAYSQLLSAYTAGAGDGAAAEACALSPLQDLAALADRLTSEAVGADALARAIDAEVAGRRDAARAAVAAAERRARASARNRPPLLGRRAAAGAPPTLTLRLDLPPPSDAKASAAPSSSSAVAAADTAASSTAQGLGCSSTTSSSALGAALFTDDDFLTPRWPPPHPSDDAGGVTEGSAFRFGGGAGVATVDDESEGGSSSGSRWAAASAMDSCSRGLDRPSKKQRRRSRTIACGDGSSDDDNADDVLILLPTTHSTRLSPLAAAFDAAAGAVPSPGRVCAPSPQWCDESGSGTTGCGVGHGSAPRTTAIPLFDPAYDAGSSSSRPDVVASSPPHAAGQAVGGVKRCRDEPSATSAIKFASGGSEIADVALLQSDGALLQSVTAMAVAWRFAESPTDTLALLADCEDGGRSFFYPRVLLEEQQLQHVNTNMSTPCASVTASHFPVLQRLPLAPVPLRSAVAPLLPVPVLMREEPPWTRLPSHALDDALGEFNRALD